MSAVKVLWTKGEKTMEKKSFRALPLACAGVVLLERR